MTSNKRHETITCRGSLYQTQDLYISKSYDNSNVRRHLQSHMVPHRCISPQHNVQMHSRHRTIFRCILRLILVTPATYGVDDGYAVTEESTTAACRKWPMIILHSLGQLRGVILLTLWILTNYLKLPLPDEKLPTAVSCWSTWPWTKRLLNSSTSRSQLQNRTCGMTDKKIWVLSECRHGRVFK